MKNIFLKFPLISITFVVIFTTQCENDEPNNPFNPLNGKTSAVFNSNKQYGSVIDIDGNVYKTIKIGDQVWMAENLRTTHYLNGDSLPNVLDNDQWNNLNTGAYCNYNNTKSLDTIATYGRLYNWFAVADTRQLAPKGWRMPDNVDWLILIDFLGGDTIASNKMKEIGILHWMDPFESDNSSGFTALPGGFRFLNRKSNFISAYVSWWTLSEYSESNAGFLFLYAYDSRVRKGNNYKVNGYSVRCIKE